MGNVKRIVNTSFWTDKKVVDEFSVEDRYFMLYLLTNPHTTQLGIYELPISTASNETGYNKDVVKVLLDRFESKYDLIRYSHDTGEVAIKNYLKHSIIKGGKPVYDCLLKEYKAISDVSLIDYIYRSLVNTDIENITLKDFINYLNSEIDNDNDNDNERIVPRIVKKFQKPTLEDVKSYCYERENGIDAQAFIDYYDSVGWKIGKNPMKDWKACIRTWERKDKERPKKPGEINWDEA